MPACVRACVRSPPCSGRGEGTSEGTQACTPSTAAPAGWRHQKWSCLRRRCRSSRRCARRMRHAPDRRAGLCCVPRGPLRGIGSRPSIGMPSSKQRAAHCLHRARAASAMAAWQGASSRAAQRQRRLWRRPRASAAEPQCSGTRKRAGLTMHVRARAQIFDLMDRDGGGSLGVDEIKQLMDMLGMKVGARGAPCAWPAWCRCVHHGRAQARFVCAAAAARTRACTRARRSGLTSWTPS